MERPPKHPKGRISVARTSLEVAPSEKACRFFRRDNSNHCSVRSAVMLCDKRSRVEVAENFLKGLRVEEIEARACLREVEAPF